MIAVINQFRSWFNARLGHGPDDKRGLVNEILSLQVISAALVGILAVASLYWGGQWVLRDNYSRWALQWTEDLNELGAPLYLADDGEALLRLERFVERYSEIDRVAYYDRDGRALFAVDNRADLGAVASLDGEQLENAIAKVGLNKPYIMTGGVLNPQQFRILAPVWTETIADDGLFEFDVANVDESATTELVGFVGIQLDFVLFHDRLLSNMRLAVVFLLVVLILLALYGRHTLRRALASFSNLQGPIQELAKGNLSVKFDPAEHREISDIVEALETTASALGERDAELVKLANHDSLTGLFNRRRFIDELKLAIATLAKTSRSSALLFVDLDQFKYVNDACGHAAGDRLIRKVADELVRSTRSKDTVARFGGDEFAVLLTKTDLDGARAAAQTILDNMRRMAHVEDDRLFHIHCSIGITVLEGEGLQHDELINQADIACRDAKSAGRNRYSIFQHSDDTAIRNAADVGWMNRLRKAVDNDGFELRFQPINRIDTGETTHHEVLIRLPAENGKLVKPDAFLPAAARFGLMSEIDFWMIGAAARAWAEYSPSEENLKFSVNLSANAFENETLVPHIRQSFERHSVPPANVIFEITESLAVRRPLHVEQQISELRLLGFELALDDFGTGYSSFGYLQKLNFDYIKIDGSFVEDLMNNPVDQKMIKLIAEIGREAGMKTVAEYVQNAEAMVLLAELGVDLAQGYFVGRPTRTPSARSTPISLALERARRQRG